MVFNQLTRQPGDDQVQEFAVDQGELTHRERENTKTQLLHQRPILPLINLFREIAVASSQHTNDQAGSNMVLSFIQLNLLGSQLQQLKTI